MSSVWASELSAAVTVTDVGPAFSAILSGLALRVRTSGAGTGVAVGVGTGVGVGVGVGVDVGVSTGGSIGGVDGGMGVGVGVAVGVGVGVGVDSGPSSSAIVVLTDDVPRVGAGPPPPAGLEMETEKVSPDSVTVSSVVLTVKVLSPGESWVKEMVPLADA